MNRTLIITLIGLSASLALATTADAQYRNGNRLNQPSFRVQIGEFEPDGDSSYWDESDFDFDREARDFEDTSLGLSYIRPLGDRLGLQVSGFFFDSSLDLAYLRFEDQSGADILHTTDLEITALSVGLIYNFAGPGAAVVPYVGAGGGVYGWRLTEFGDFIDFSDPDLEIFEDFFEEEGEELGLYFTAGLEVPLGETVSIFAEARWDSAEADLAGDFRDLGILDLSGKSYSAGLSWSF